MDKFKIFYPNQMPAIPEVAKFPGGEIRVKIPDATYISTQNYTSARIEAILLDSADMMTLVMLVDALRELGIVDLSATIPYVPYARQDRVCNPGEALSIRAFANVINSLKFSRVNISDPHSDVTPALLNNCVITPRTTCMQRHTELYDWICRKGWEGKPLYLVSPDAGSVKKSYDIAKTFPQFKGIIFAEKIRDIATGRIQKTTIADIPADIAEARVLVCDDIGDGFGTFLPLAEQLRAHNPMELNIYVTHGIFSRGEDILHPLYDNVWCSVDFRKYQ